MPLSPTDKTPIANKYMVKQQNDNVARSVQFLSARKLEKLHNLLIVSLSLRVFEIISAKTSDNLVKHFKNIVSRF